MTEQEVYKMIKPLLESSTEGIFWDYKKTLSDIAGITKDVLAFSNSNYNGDSFIIVGVSEIKNRRQRKYRIALSQKDRIRLNTSDNYLYLPGKWDIHGLTAKDIDKMKQFSAQLTQKLSSSMLISQPECEFIPVQIKKSRWLYVIIVKKKPGVFISRTDIPKTYEPDKVEVKQGVLYVRVADSTIGSDQKTEMASATEYIRVWKQYIDWLRQTDFPAQM